MKRLISERFALNGLLLILSLFVLLHLLILLGIIPYQMVWGGRLKNKSEMVTFETLSILINLLMLTAVAIKARWLKVRMHPMVLKIVFWLMTGLFFLNTLGNFLSNNAFEKTVFTPLTILLLFFSLRLALSKTREI